MFLRILEPVSRRTTLWILAAFLSLCATQAVPAARVQLTGQNCSIVWVARAHAKQRVTIEKRISTAPSRAIVAIFPRDEIRIAAQLHAHSYRQRPPPFSLS